MQRKPRGNKEDAVGKNHVRPQAFADLSAGSNCGPSNRRMNTAALNYTLRNWLVSRQIRVPETVGERETV